jgi:hypothetical protein
MSFYKRENLILLLDVNKKEELKVNALLQEFREVRSEVRIFEVLQILCIILSALTFTCLIIAAILSQHYILLFVSPLLSLFLVLLATGILAYNVNLGLRASQIEDSLKKILGEPIIQWEMTVGIFGAAGADVLSKKVEQDWVRISVLVIVAGMAPIIIGLIYGSEAFYDEVGNWIWSLVGGTRR